MSNLTTNPVTCPDCRNTFLHPFVCTTCGAQKLYDETVRSQAATIDRLTARNVELEQDNANLRTVMIAAAEEILQHWQAHCDAEGYGPANLVRRLEMGIPSEYGYTAGAFEKLRLRNVELVKALEEAQRDAGRYRWLRDNLGKTVSHWFCATSNLEADIDAALKEATK